MIALRTATADDRRFLVSSWEESFQKAHTAGLILMSDWAAIMRHQLGKILDREYVKSTVAFETDDPAHIYGYIVAEPDESPALVYWVYVKQPYRKQGIARTLLASAGLESGSRFNYVCSTPVMPRLAQKLPLAKWAPLLGRYSREHRQHGTRR